MRKARFTPLICALLAAPMAQGDVPRVVTDIAPVHSITAYVMGDLGQPDVLLNGGGDPHHFSLKPSQLRSLAQANLIIWMGRDLTPWLARGLDVATGAHSLELLHIAEPASRIPIPSLDRAHTDHEDAGDHGDHGDHSAGDDDEAAGAHSDTSTDDTRTSGHDHGHGHLDPHAWLDPLNGAAYGFAIAEALAAQDPDNAQGYRSNATRLANDINRLTQDLNADLNTLRDKRILSYHDGYRYFLHRFDLPQHGAIANVHGAAPSGARLASLRRAYADAAFCLFTEPDAQPRVFEVIAPGETVQMLDPLGHTLPIGPDFYSALLRAMADALLTCAD